MNPGPQELEGLIVQLMSTDNAARAAAEATYNTWKQSPDTLLVAVLQVLMNSKYEEARSMCIILLRGLLVRTTAVWAATSPAVRQRVCSELLVAVINESNPVLRQKLNIIIAEIGARLVQDGQWPELMPFLQASFESQIDSKKETALIIFGELASSLGSLFQQYYPALKNNLHSGLVDPSLNVRIAALLATSNFLQGFFKPEHRAIFSPLVPLMIETVKAILIANKEEEAQNALKLLVQVAESDPLFLQPCVQSVVQTMLAIANNSTYDQDTRHLACEILLTLAESRPAMIRKIPECSSELIQIAFKLMLTLDDIPLDEWNKFDQDEDESGMENYDYGEEYLNRLSLALGGRTIVPQLFPIVIKLLENKQDWKHRYCAAMSVSIIGEGCVKKLAPNLSDVLNQIVPLLNDPHPKVRWAACNCIGQMSTDFGPKLQKNFHTIIVPALATVMDDVNNPRTRGHAAAALVNFVELWQQEVLINYLEPLLGKLFGLLQSGNLLVQQHAVIAVAAIAEMAEEHFVKYQDIFMPNLLQVVVQCKNKEHRKLRGLAIECISMIGCAVGKDKFNGNQVMEILMREQALSVDYDDPQRPYIEQAMVRLCGCLKKDFTPYLSTVLPPIMRIAEKSDIVVSDDQQEQQDGWEYILLPTKQGEKFVGIRTASLDEKASACELIVAYAKALGGDFFSYVDPVLKLMLPLLKFYYTEDVRAAAAECMPALLVSAAEHTKNAGAAAGADAMYVRNMFCYMLPTFVEAIEQELEPEILNVMLVAFVHCLDAVGDNAFDAQQLQRMSEMVINLFKDYQEFIEAQKDKLDDVDEEEEERMSEEISSYEDVIANVADAIGRIGRHHKPEAFLPVFQPVLQFIMEFIKPDARVAERHVAVCVVDDIIDHGGEAACGLFPLVMPFFLEYILDKDPAIRQAVAFGIGIFARVGKQQFLPYVPSVLPRLHQVCTHTDGHTEEFEMATDNAISAVGAICATYASQVDLATILPQWLQYLPMRSDTEEALVVYNLLCDFVQQVGPLLLGNEYQHLPKLVKLIAEIVDTEFVDDALTTRLAAIIKGISSLPQEVTRNSWSTLSPDAQAKLQKLLSS